jgi:membrane protease subunit HflC
MRRSWPTIVVVTLVLLGLLVYLFTETVRIDEVAAHYRLHKVKRLIRPRIGEEGAISARSTTEAGVPVKTKAGLCFKLPLIDKYKKMDQRIRVVDGPLTQIQLPDENQLIPRVYATWRITDPVAFEKTLKGDAETARKRLTQVINGRAPEVFGRYNLEDVVNTDPAKLKFDQIEQEILDGVKASVESADKAYGIEVLSLGITLLALPEDATAAVFSRMGQERTTEANKLTEEGKKIKRTMVAEAQEKRDKLLADAEATAKRIRAQGEAGAALTYKTFKEDPELAIFLRELESLREIAKSAAGREEPITIVVTTRGRPFRLLEGEIDREPVAEQGASATGQPEPVEDAADAVSSASGGDK